MERNGRYGSCGRGQCRINGGVLRPDEARIKDDGYEPRHVVRCDDEHIAAAYDRLFSSGVPKWMWNKGVAEQERIEEEISAAAAQLKAAAEPTVTRHASAVPPGLGRRSFAEAATPA